MLNDVLFDSSFVVVIVRVYLCGASVDIALRARCAQARIDAAVADDKSSVTIVTTTPPLTLALLVVVVVIVDRVVGNNIVTLRSASWKRSQSRVVSAGCCASTARARPRSSVRAISDASDAALGSNRALRCVVASRSSGMLCRCVIVFLKKRLLLIV